MTSGSHDVLDINTVDELYQGSGLKGFGGRDTGMFPNSYLIIDTYLLDVIFVFTPTFFGNVL